MRRISRIFILVTVFILLLTTMASAQADKTIVTILAEDGRFTTLLAAVELTETEQAFSEGHWTLFAPTDQAFAELGLNAENIGTQLGLGQTVDLLLYQAMNKEVTSDGAKDMLGDVTMSNGWLAGLKWFDGSLWVNDESRVTEPDIFAANGIIHVVNQVIIPPWPRVEEDTGLALMASIEEAKLLEAEISEQEEVAEEAAPTLIADADEAASEEDTPAEITAEAGESDEPAQEPVTIPEGSLLDVMAKDGRFTTYLQAVGDLDLIVPFSEGAWTIFAPTDAAFAAEGVDASNISTEYSVGELADLLMYHALDEAIASDIAKTMLGNVTMRNGQIAGLKFFDGSLWMNDNAQVVDPDIRATNGIIHAVNEIIERPWPRIEVIDMTTSELEQSGDLP